MKLSKGNEKKLNDLAVILLKMVVDPFFLYFLTTTYAYCGSGASPNIAKLCISWAALLGLLCLCRLIRGGDVKFFIELFMVLSIVPTGSVWWIKNEDSRAFLLIMLFWGVFVLSSAFLTRTKQYTKIRDCENKPCSKNFNGLAVLIFVWLLISTIYFSYRYGSFRLMINFSDVYKYRLSTGNEMSSIEAYIFAWNTNIFLPMILAYFLHAKRYFRAAVISLLFLLNYAIYGNKSIFFMLFAVFGIWFLNEKKIIQYATTIIAGVISLTIAATMAIGKTKLATWPIAILYRLLFIPAEGHFYYYDFFQEHELLYLRQSILRFFSPNPYSEEVSKIIGSSAKYNLSGKYNNLNNGLFSDAYMNFGGIGVWLYPLAFVLIIYLIERYFSDMDKSIRFSVYIGMVMYCISAALFSWLLTGGVIVLLILLVFNRKKRIVF